jgi:hypothetical protein
LENDFMNQFLIGVLLSITLGLFSCKKENADFIQHDVTSVTGPTTGSVNTSLTIQAATVLAVSTKWSTETSSTSKLTQYRFPNGLFAQWMLALEPLIIIFPPVQQERMSYGFRKPMEVQLIIPLPYNRWC